VLFPIGAIASFDSRSQNADGSLSGDIHVPASAGYSPFCHLSRWTRYYIPASDIQSSCYTSGAHIASCVCIHDRVIYCRKNEIPRCWYQCSLWTPGTSILYFSPAIFAVSYSTDTTCLSSALDVACRHGHSYMPHVLHRLWRNMARSTRSDVPPHTKSMECCIRILGSAILSLGHDVTDSCRQICHSDSPIIELNRLYCTVFKVSQIWMFRSKHLCTT
jgi:hypothetical protein